jgi:hypothetical protein
MRRTVLKLHCGNRCGHGFVAMNPNESQSPPNGTLQDFQNLQKFDENKGA